MFGYIIGAYNEKAIVLEAINELSNDDDLELCDFEIKSVDNIFVYNDKSAHVEFYAYQDGKWWKDTSFVNSESWTGTSGKHYKLAHYDGHMTVVTDKELYQLEETETFEEQQEYKTCDGDYVEVQSGTHFSAVICKESDSKYKVRLFRNDEVAHTNLYHELSYSSPVDITVSDTSDQTIVYIMHDNKLEAYSMYNTGRWKRVRMWPSPGTEGLNRSHPYVEVELNLTAYNNEGEQ